VFAWVGYVIKCTVFLSTNISVPSFCMHVFKESQQCATDWEQRLEEGMKLWRHLQEKAKSLENWISSAEYALNSLSGDNSSHKLLVCPL